VIGGRSQPGTLFLLLRPRGAQISSKLEKVRRPRDDDAGVVSFDHNPIVRLYPGPPTKVSWERDLTFQRYGGNRHDILPMP
jgi:hypothetical protein